jgi:hypothetical protein
VYLSLPSILTMKSIDVLIWTAVVLVAARALASGDGRLWLVLGVLAGIGLQNKLSVLFLGFGVAAGLVAAREWAHLGDRRLWLGGTLAGLIFAPHVVWQAAHGWPTLEFVRRATELKNVAFSPLEFLAEQVLLINPALLPLWGGGLVFLLFAPAARRFRALGWVYPAGVYRELPEADRRRACVFGQNYGHAGAIDYFRGSYDLPPAVAGHNSYWLWGPGRCTGEVLIVIGGRRSDHERGFEEVREAGRFECRDCMPYEADLTLYVARRLRLPLAEAWPRVKHFD